MDIREFAGIKFLITNPNDYVQKLMLSQNALYEEKILEHLCRYMPENLSIVDAGAHIGTHSLYWAKYAKAKNIWAFEPQKDVFETLKKNIELNGYSDVIHPCNMGLSKKPGKASIAFSLPNMSALTQIEQTEDGDIELESLDTFDFKGEKIDFIKIDTERHEILILKGAKKLIERDRPRVFVEISCATRGTVRDIMESYNYKEVAMFPDETVPFFENLFFVPR